MQKWQPVSSGAQSHSHDISEELGHGKLGLPSLGHPLQRALLCGDDPQPSAGGLGSSPRVSRPETPCRCDAQWVQFLPRRAMRSGLGAPPLNVSGLGPQKAGTLGVSFVGTLKAPPYLPSNPRGRLRRVLHHRRLRVKTSAMGPVPVAR